MKTFSQLRDEVLRWMDEYGDTGTTKAIVEQAIKDAHEKRCVQCKWPFMRSRPYSFTLDTSKQEYTLHEQASSLDYLWNTTQEFFLVEVSDRNLPGESISYTDDLVPARYFSRAGYWPVRYQPVSAERITITSDQAEGAAPTLTIEGEDANGDVISETITVPNSGALSFARINRLTKAGTVAGTWTIKGYTSNTVFVTLTTSQLGKQYPVIRLFNPPESADSVQYQFFKKPTVLSLDNDIPDIPYPYCSVLVYDALLMISAYNEVTSEGVDIWRREQLKWELNLLTLGFETDSIAGQQTGVIVGY